MDAKHTSPGYVSAEWRQRAKNAEKRIKELERELLIARESANAESKEHAQLAIELANTRGHAMGMIRYYKNLSLDEFAQVTTIGKLVREWEAILPDWLLEEMKP